MKSLLSIPLSSEKLWEFSFILVGLYLFLHPVLGYPTSLAVALGGGLLLLLFRSISTEITQTIGKAWCLLLVYFLASSFWSVSPGITLQSAGLVFLGTLLYAMAKGNDLATQSRIEVIGLIMALAASLMAIYQWFYGFESLVPLLPGLSGEEHEIVHAAIYNKRASGPFVTHGALAAFLILFIPLGFVLWKTQPGFKKKFYGALTLVLIGGLLTTQSVGAFFCLTLAVLMVLLKRKSKAAMGMVMAGGIAGILALILARGVQSWLLAALGTRLILWKAALFLFGAHPLLGTGLGTFGEIYQQAGLPMETGSRFTHNVFLQVMVETGLVGLSIFLVVLVDLARRLKIPSRWEGWGVGTGILAFLLFSLLDLPFQMPEIVWVFTMVAARLELRPAKTISLPEIPKACLGYGLLTIFLISGFWPPLRPWNFALLAGALWILVSLFQQKFDKVPLWIAAGALFLLIRGFVSPSALGTVWFLEISGVLLAFYLVLPCFRKPQTFLKLFCAFGLVWALKIWWESLHYSAPGFDNWIHFQYSDVKDWIIFPNPKQIAIFLIPLVFIFWKKPRNWASLLGILFALLTMIRLKASGAVLGIGAGVLFLVKPRNRFWLGLGALALIVGLFYVRSIDPSATKWERFGIWNSAIKVWETHPLVGAGPGAFAGLYHLTPFPRTSGVSRYLMDPQYAHNEFLELLTAFGLIGFGFGLLILIAAWRRVQDPARRSALAGLGAASLVDFCLHTPLISLVGVGLITLPSTQKPKMSLVGGFLTLGLVAGLFVSPVFSGALKNQAEAGVSFKRFLPVDLRNLEAAEKLNAWDARYAAAKADYLEKLYLETKDPVWAKRSDETFERVLDLEKADGQWRLKNAERLTSRLMVDSMPETHQKAALAWTDTDKTLPYNAFVNFERGLFLVKEGDKERALLEFMTAEEKEPNFAAAWLYEGRLLKEKGEVVKSRVAFQKALEVYNQWKDADRIDPLEKQLVYLSPETVEFLKKELAQ